MRMLLPVGRSGLAIAAGYAGLFALLIVPAPLALVLGILAVRDIKKNPRNTGWARATVVAIPAVASDVVHAWYDTRGGWMSRLRPGTIWMIASGVTLYSVLRNVAG